jgi:glyoxylase-like metal-dependent hydrolase (beta-lactamase superfamily II)
MPEILPNVHQIIVNYGGRPLRPYLLIGPAASLLIDAGDTTTAEKDLLPYFQSIGFDPARLTYVLITHPDIDHSAGLAAVKKLCPNAKLICGTADRYEVESPLGLVDSRARYHWKLHHEGPDGKDRDAMLAKSGEFTPVDFTCAGGELLRLGPGDGPLDTVEILHLPGHSHGHLGVFIPAHNTAIIGDAVHDRCALLFDGNPALPVTYMYIDEYISTIARLKAMKLERIHSAHWRDCTTPEEVTAWLDLSRDYAISAEKTILELVRQSPAGVTLHELLQQIKPVLGTWPVHRDSLARFFVAGHLEHLQRLGLMTMTDEPPVRWIAR